METRSSKPQDPFEKWWPRLRDAVTLSVGAYLVLTTESEAKLTVGFALLVVPAAALAQKWLRGKIEDEDKS